MTTVATNGEKCRAAMDSWIEQLSLMGAAFLGADRLAAGVYGRGSGARSSRTIAPMVARMVKIRQDHSAIQNEWAISCGVPKARAMALFAIE